jgi:hypothetical protein
MDKRKVDGSATLVAYMFTAFLLALGFMLGWVAKGFFL